MPTTSDIPAGGGRVLRRVQAEADDKAPALAAALAIEAVGAVLVLAGAELGGDDRLRARLVQLVGRGLVRAAQEAGALCVVRGGDAGLAGLVGRAVADIDAAPPLLGIAPAARLALPDVPAAPGDELEPPLPGLTHLLLTPGGPWGSELRLKAEVAQAVADGKPVLMVLIGGAEPALAEVLQAVRRRWPVLVVNGSGGAADALAAQWKARSAQDDDPVVAEILADGNLTCITLGEKVGETVETMVRQVLRQSGGDSVLRQAWRRFAAIDAAAVRQQTEFMDTQWRILALGVLAVLLAIVHSQLIGPVAADPFAARDWLDTARDLLGKAIGFVLIVVPIGTSVLIAATNRFKPGKRWVLLRSAAENIKREIYRFRLRADSYAADDTREKNLSEAVEDITRRLARTEANTTALPVYDGAIPPPNAASARDDGLSHLSTDQYVRLRLEDQLRWYRDKSVKLEAELRRLQWWVLGAGAVGTLLAAIGGAAVIWITLSTALASAFMTYLTYRQTETTLVGYNQTATDLDNILSWWTALEPDEQAQRVNIEALVEHTEKVLADELAGWTQRMNDALEKLREAQTKDREERQRAREAEGGGAGGGAEEGSSDGEAGPASTPAAEAPAPSPADMPAPSPADGAPPPPTDAPPPPAADSPGPTRP